MKAFRYPLLSLIILLAAIAPAVSQTDRARPLVKVAGEAPPAYVAESYRRNYKSGAECWAGERNMKGARIEWCYGAFGETPSSGNGSRPGQFQGVPPRAFSQDTIPPQLIDPTAQKPNEGTCECNVYQSPPLYCPSYTRAKDKECRDMKWEREQDNEQCLREAQVKNKECMAINREWLDQCNKWLLKTCR